MLVLLGAAMLLGAGCGSGSDGEAESTVPAAMPTPSEYVETFELVWSTINDEFYDHDFGGVDWAATHDRYLPLITTTDSGEAFVELINTMLFELGVSHLGFLPAGEEQAIDPILTAEGWIGLDVRLLDGEPVVTAVAAGSPAARRACGPVTYSKASSIRASIRSSPRRRACPHDTSGDGAVRRPTP